MGIETPPELPFDPDTSDEEGFNKEIKRLQNVYDIEKLDDPSEAMKTKDYIDLLKQQKDERFS